MNYELNVADKDELDILFSEITACLTYYENEGDRREVGYTDDDIYEWMYELLVEVHKILD